MENDFLQYLQDLEHGEKNIAPDELAPEVTEPVTASGEVYDERNDKEIRREAIENRARRIQEARLNETRRGDRIAMYAETTETPNYEEFMNSEFSESKDTEDQFNKDLGYLKRQGFIGTGKKYGNVGGRTYTASGGVKDKGKNNVYDRPDSYEAGDYAKQVDWLSSKYGTASVKGSADETFQDIFNIVKNIIMKTTDKKHAIVYGDPGVGKCLHYDTLLKIKVDEEIKKCLSIYINSYSSTDYVTCSIGQLVNFIDNNYGIKFNGYDEFIVVPFELRLQDENNDWNICSKLYRKQAPLYELKLKNGVTLKAANDHILVDSKYKHIKVKDLKVGEKFYYVEVISNELIEEKADVYSPQIESERHLYKTANDLIHHNTFEVTATCDRFMKQSPSGAKYVYESGDIGSSMSSLVPFFYYHSQNTIIVLDDNDKMIMNGLSQDIMNIMKAIMDPKASTDKPITVRGTLMKAFQAGYDDLMAADAKELKEQHIFEIDQEALKEGRFILNIDNKPVIDKYISLREQQELQNNMKPLREDVHKRKYDDLRGVRLQEKDDLMDDLLDYDDQSINRKGKQSEDEDDYVDTDMGDDDMTFPRKFFFNSSIIFISNLEMADINTAVLDRAEAVEVKLTLDQFLERLGSIYGGLAKISKDSMIDSKLRDWSKKCVYTVIGIVIEAWKANKPVFGKPIEINRKLTFRMFDEFVAAWERYAMDRSERVDGIELSGNNKAYLDKLSVELIPDIIRRKVIPFLATTTRK